MGFARDAYVYLSIHRNIARDAYRASLARNRNIAVHEIILLCYMSLVLLGSFRKSPFGERDVFYFLIITPLC